MLVQTEAQFQAAVVQLASLHSWVSYHTHDSRRSDPGWPDVVFCRPPELLIVEFKTDKGRIRQQCPWRTACFTNTSAASTKRSAGCGAGTQRKRNPDHGSSSRSLSGCSRERVRNDLVTQ